jgi:transposase
MGCPISLGSVMAKEEEMSRALGQPYEQVKEQVRRARVKCVDETGWRRARHWLFAAASKAACVFGLSHSRTWPEVKKLLGEEVSGTICTDRYGIYEKHPLDRRGLCWAHLKRDFQRCVDRGGAGGEVGEKGLKLCHWVFGLWRKLREGQISRVQLEGRLKPVRWRMRKLLREGARCGVKKTMGFCRNVLRLWPALWRFASVKGLEPTNNLAERMLRPAVLWRKQSLGSHSRAGCRFVERILSVSATLKMQGQSVLDYLEAALRAHRLDQPPPALSG